MNKGKRFMRTAVKKVNNTIRPVIRRGREYAQRHPAELAGGMAGYSLGVLIERIPLVGPVTGPVPRLTGFVIGAVIGHCVHQAWEEVMAEGSHERVQETNRLLA